MQLTVYKLTDDPACFVAVATKAGAAVQVEWIEKAEDLAAFEARPDVVVNKSFTKATLRTCSLFGKLPPGWSAADFRHVGG